MTEGVLLDTCALIWLVHGDPMLDEAIARIKIAARSGQLLISPVSAWEIGILSRPKPNRVLTFLPNAQDWFARALSREGTRTAALTSRIAIAASELPEPLHSDPADRLLISTAREMAVPIVTRDARIVGYGRQGHVAVIPC